MSVWEGVRFGLWTGFVIRGGCGVGQVSGGQIEPEDFVSVEPQDASIVHTDPCDERWDG